MNIDETCPESSSIPVHSSRQDVSRPPAPVAVSPQSETAKSFPVGLAHDGEISGDRATTV